MAHGFIPFMGLISNDFQAYGRGQESCAWAHFLAFSPEKGQDPPSQYHEIFSEPFPQKEEDGEKMDEEPDSKGK